MKSNLKLFSMLVGTASVVMLAGCGEGPVDVAKKYHKAVYKDADSGKVSEYVKDSYKEDAKKQAKSVAARKNRSFGDAKIDGDTAKVKVTQKDAEGNKTTNEFQLEKEDGKWKISNIKNVRD